MTRSVEIPDAAVEALAHVLFDREWVPGDWRWEQYPEPNRWQELARTGLVAARPYLMPTVEAIKEAISDELDGEGILPTFVAPKLARRVFDLLNSEPIRRDYAECPDEDCRSGGPHPISQDGVEMECRACHVGFPNPFRVAGGES